jgi:hypothetical protein
MKNFEELDPIEQSKRLINRFHDLGFTNIPVKYEYIRENEMANAKQCALLEVDDILIILRGLNSIVNVTPALIYWGDVQQELLK